MSLSSRVAFTMRALATLAVTVALTLTGLAGAQATSSPAAFVSTWNTENAGTSSSNQITLPLRSTGTYNFIVEWGDGTSDTITAYSDPDVTHSYPTPDVYTVTITGTIEGWAFQNAGDVLKITGISSWGPLKLGNDTGYFWGAENLEVTATDALDLTGTTNLTNAFARAGRFNNPAVTSWDVSQVTSMRGMFAGNVHGTSEWTTMTFNQPIGSWNTASLTDPAWMFAGNAAFNQDLSAWDMSNVTTLDGMFSHATTFNGSINAWDTTRVTSLSSTFENARAFNQPLDNWNTANVEVMRAAFYDAVAFNQSLSTWNTSQVWHFGISFTGALSFNQSLGTWSMASATQVDDMLNNTAMAWDNYDATLIGWSTQTLLPLGSGMTLGAGGRKYTDAASIARATLVGSKQWPITGDELIASGVPAVTMSGAAPPTTQVGSTSSTTITVQNSGTARLTISDISVVGLGAVDYTITSNTCGAGTLAALASCSVTLTFSPTRDGHRYTFVQVTSDAATSPNLYDVSAFGYGSCSATPFSSGSGTSVDPYIIMTLDQLNCINAATSTAQYRFLNQHKYFRLGADIDAGSSVEAFQPIGTWWYEFNGDFDGDGHVLTNVVIDDTNAGVFPWLDGGANIHDLTIRDAQVTTLESGGVLTAGAWATTVSNVVIDGGRVVATRGWQVGGLAGYFEGTMTEVSSSAAVESVADAEWASVGGLAGQLEGPLSRGYSTGSVTVTARATDTVVVGGLLGGTNAAVTDSYSTSSVSVTGGTSDSRVAGFVGDMWGTGSIGTSYAAGAVSATTDGVVAGFVGALRDTSSVADVLWNTQTTGIATDEALSGSTGVTTSAMRSLATYSGWDIAQAPVLTSNWVLRTGYAAQLSWTDPGSPAISPTGQSVTASVGVAITPTERLTPTGFLGAVTYSVTPSLPAGLSLDSATGVVSGTPTAIAETGAYTITGTGSIGGEDTATVTITVAASPDPEPAPGPRPRPGPSTSEPSTGSAGSSTPSSDVVATPAPTMTATPPVATSIESQPAYRQPTLAKPVTGSVMLLPAKVAASTPVRVLRQRPSPRLGSAPVISTVVNQPVKLLVPGLTSETSYGVQMKARKGYVALGSVMANANGRLQLPVFRTAKPSTTTIAMVAPSGRPVYLKVRAVTPGRGAALGN